jgi:hypothetical protein
VISLLANLDARTPSSPVWQEDDIATPQITLGSSPQHLTVNGNLSGLPAATPQIVSGHPTTNYSIQENLVIRVEESNEACFENHNLNN